MRQMYKVFYKDIFVQVTENLQFFEKIDGYRKIVFDPQKLSPELWKNLVDLKENILVFTNEKKASFKSWLLTIYTGIEAAGGIVQNEDGQFLLIKRRGMWDLPKGKIDAGESILEAALREVEEECGVQPFIPEGAWRSESYHVYEEQGQTIFKTTHWFHMLASSKSSLVPQTEEDIEIVKWVNKEELPSHLDLSYPNIQMLMDGFLQSTIHE